MSRPLFMHERLAANLDDSLSTARDGDLTTMKRGDLTWLRYDLRKLPYFQNMCGEVATPHEWAAAVERVNAELARRDAIKLAEKAAKALLKRAVKVTA
jgi:hypothetical protein